MKAKTLTSTLNVLMLLVFFSLGMIFGYVYCQLNHFQLNHTPKENSTMIIRTANGSLMKVTEEEGQRMIDEHPYDYSHELEGCEICVKSSWTVLEVQVGTKELTPVRMCYSCWKEKGGSDEGWNDIIDYQLHNHRRQPV